MKRAFDSEAAADRACQALIIAIADLLRVAQEIPRGPRLFALWVSARTHARAMAHLTDPLAARVYVDSTNEGGYYACPSHL